MGRQVWKPGNMLYPLPAVLVSVADRQGNANLFTVAWTGTVCSDPPMVSISVRPERYSYHMIEETGEFVVNLTTEALACATDYCGVKSGRDVDKWGAMKLTPLGVPCDQKAGTGHPSHVSGRGVGGACGRNLYGRKRQLPPERRQAPGLFPRTVSGYRKGTGYFRLQRAEETEAHEEQRSQIYRQAQKNSRETMTRRAVWIQPSPFGCSFFAFCAGADRPESRLPRTTASAP